MEKELIIRSSSNVVDFALLKDGKLIELHQDNEESNAFQVGNIYLAKVKKPVSGLNAAFMNVGHSKDGFLHYNDLGPNIKTLMNFTKKVMSGKMKSFSPNTVKFEEEITKKGSISDILSTNQSILVQVVKEPISTKGPRMSSELSIAGRYLVLVPFSNRVAISQKIESNDEKDRLKKMITAVKPPGFGVIIRTVAEGKNITELEKDLTNLMEKWNQICQSLSKAHAPQKVYGEINKASSILRDVFNDSFTGIYVDNEDLYYQIREYLQEFEPAKASIVKLYNNKNVPLFEKYNIERQIKTSFGRTVTMEKGTYLIIEHTEALHVIDVNSGNRSSKAESQEDNALQVNMIAAKEIARQLRLRDMGGIIVVDFIDMSNAENRKALYDLLKSEMEDDKAKHKILPPSKFGLVQITRQRVRPEISIKTKEENPNNSTGEEIEAPIKVINNIVFDLERILKTKNNIALNTHPFVAAYLTTGWYSIRLQWLFKYKKWIKIIPRDAYTYLEYHFFDNKGNQIE